MNVETSIIIPCYNAEKYIAEAIQSVLDQTYINWELIIIDDGSKDSSSKIIAKFLNDNRISFHQQTNSGVSSARNNGLKIAQGNYITYLDADDVWFKDNLKEKVNYLRNNAIDVVYSSYEVINEKSESISKISDKAIYPTLKDILLQKGNYSTAPSGLVIKKEVLHKIGGFDTNLSNNADQDIWIRILFNNYKIALIEKPLWKYRIHENNMSNNISLLEKDSLYMFKKVATNNMFGSFWFKQKCYSKLYLMLAGSWWKEGNNQLRGGYFIFLAFINYPFIILTLLQKLFRAR
ncbi:MAG: glycosyltransferase [Chitinophagales bacterium]|nr:glycosyltransferase [Chitinophagales bacterium]